MPFARWFKSLLCVAAVSPLPAQLSQFGTLPLHGAPAAFRSPELRVNVDLVLLSVTVTDRVGAAVDNLPETSFTVFEDNAPRPIVSFSREDAPCSVGVVVDISGSMESKMGAVPFGTRCAERVIQPCAEIAISKEVQPQHGELLADLFAKGHTLYVCGNGG
jgi:hypothetical protein